MVATAVAISPVSEEDIRLLDLHLMSARPEKHRERIRVQREGHGVYLVARHGGVPVGHLLLLWIGAHLEPMASQLRGCPHIEDLYVHPVYRSQGVGSRLLAVAESLAEERGYGRVGLGVGIDNPRARSLYERTGFRDSMLGPYRHGSAYVDAGGRQRFGSEVDIYMVKELSSPHLRPRERESAPGRLALLLAPIALVALLSLGLLRWPGHRG